MEIKPKKIGEKFFYRLLFTGKPVDGNRFSVNDRKQNQRRQKKNLKLALQVFIDPLGIIITFLS